MSQIELADFQVSRRALPWMLAAFVASVLPHVAHLPWWLLLASALCVGWRWAVHRGRLSYPPRRLQALFALLLVVGVYLHYRTLLGHISGTALLLAMYSLKLLEMYKERDAYVVILIGYFFAATTFLFHFDILTAGWVIAVAVLFTTALVAINSSLDTPRFAPLKRTLLMFAQSVPIAVLLFVVMPRIGPLWGMGLKPAENKTGISEEMSPGSVGDLALSGDLAFRVEFEGDVPPTARLYWRGLTLGRFDGRTWRQVPALIHLDELTWFPWESQRPDWLQQLDQAAATAPAIDYVVYLEPTQRPWLFALTVPMAAGEGIGIVADHRLRARQPVKTLMRYNVRSVPQLPREVDVPAAALREYLALPDGAAPRTREWALQQRAEAGDDATYLQRVLTRFGDGSFTYTLQPPALGAQPVDEFLFDTRRGFCEHYAGSFVVLMRAAGIPARVVAGYQGGELNLIDGTLEVRQYDAHAWAEIWVAGRGWVEVDPTSYVSPARIERGTAQTLGAERAAIAGRSLAELLMGESFTALRDVAAFVSHRWNTWVLGFDEGRQQGVLSRWLGNLSPYRIGMFVAAAGGVTVAVLLLWMFGGALFTRVDPVLREYRRFGDAWAARGHARADGEGPQDYALRLCAADPRRAAEISRFMALYVQLAYAGAAADRQALARLREARSAAV